MKKISVLFLFANSLFFFYFLGILLQRWTPERRRPVVHQDRLEEGLEEVSQRAQGFGSVLLQGQGVAVTEGPRLLGHVRREPGVLRRWLAKEIQSAHRTLFRDQTPVPAAAQVNQVHKIRVRRGRANAAKVDVGHTDRQVWTTVARQLRVGTGRR